MSNMASPTSPSGLSGTTGPTPNSNPNPNSNSNNTMSSETSNGNGNGNESFPLDFLSFSNFNTDGSAPGSVAGTSPQTQMQEKNSGGTPNSTLAGMGMDFDFSQFATLAQDDNQSQIQGQGQGQGQGHSVAGGSSRGGSVNGSLRKRGSMSSVSGNGSGRPNTGSGSAAGGGEGGLGMDLDLKGGLSNADFQMMLDAAAAENSGNGNSHGSSNINNGESFDQASLQQQLEHIHMQSPLVFGQLAGMAQQHHLHQQQQHQSQPMSQSQSQSQSQGQGQSPYNALAQYLTSPLAQTQTIGDQHNGNGNGNGTSGSQDGDDRKKWMLATGLGGLFTPGPSGEMIPQVRPEHMSPMQLEMLAREGFDIDFSNNMPLLSPALSQQQSNSSYASPMHTAGFPSASPFHQAQAYNSLNTSNQQLPPSPLEALQIQQRHFQEQLALLQHQQRQMQATAEAVVAAGAGAGVSTSNSPYVAAAGTSNSGSSSRMATTPGTGNGHGGPHSANASPSYFSPLTSPALEATRGNGNGNHHGFSRHHHNQTVSQHYSPGFDPRSNKRTPHPLSALSSPALNPIGSSGGAQQTLSPALGPQNNADMSDPEYFRALVGMLDNQGQQTLQHQQPPQHHQQQHQQSNGGLRSNQSRRSLTQDSGNGGMSSAHPSPINVQSIDTASLSSPLVGPSSATSTSGPGPNRHSLPVRTRPSPMIKPTPAQRGHHSRNGSTQHSPIVNTSLQQQQRYNNYVHGMATVPHPNYLPPAAIDQRGVQQHQHQMTLSTTSETPSPVDLSTIMPPPPIPGSSGVKGVIPMTPATLMNLGAGRPAGAVADAAVSNGTSSKSGKSDDRDTSSSSQPHTQSQLPKRQAARNSTHSQSQSQASQSSKPARKTGAGGSGSTTPTLAPTNSGAAGGASNGKKVKIAPAGKRTLAARPPGVGVRAATKGAAAAAAQQATLPEGETRKTSHKAAEQKRRDSLKAGFDELRLLLPPINTEALDPESGEPIPGSSAPRLLPKSSLVPDDNPNRGVSKVALLKFGNEYIERLHEKVDKRDDYIERLRSEVERLRLSVGAGGGQGEMVTGPEGEDLLEMNMLDGEEEYDGDEEADLEGEGGEDGEDIDEDQIEADDDDLEGEGDGLDFDLDGEASNGMELDQDEYTEPTLTPASKSTNTNTKRRSIQKGVGTGKSPALGATTTNTTTKRPQVSRGLSNGHGARGRKVEA